MTKFVVAIIFILASCAPYVRYRYLPRLSVSEQNEIFFSVADTLGDGVGITIRRVDLNSNVQHILTSDTDLYAFPDVSHSGNKLLFGKEFVWLGDGNFYISDTDGKNKREILTDTNIFHSIPYFSQDDQSIYFRGGALPKNDSSTTYTLYRNCLDIFSIDLNGENLNRLTNLYITSMIYSFIFVENDSKILLTIAEEDWEDDFGKQDLAEIGIINREPFKTGTYIYNLKDSTIKPLMVRVITDSFRDVDKGDLYHPDLRGAYHSVSGNYLLVYEREGYYKIDLNTLTMDDYLHSLNGSSWGSLSEYDKPVIIKLIDNETKMVGLHGSRLFLIDLETRQIIRDFNLDSMDVIPYQPDVK